MRKPEWPEILINEIELAKQREFVWGVNDCCLFAADIVLAMTGIDYAAEFRGQYNSKTSAIRALRRYGVITLVDTMNAKLDQVPILRAQRGDVVMAEKALGVCLGAVAAFVSPDFGLTMLPMKKCDLAWRVC